MARLRTPLGRFLSELWLGEATPEQVLRKTHGAEIARRAMQAFTTAELEDAARDREATTVRTNPLTGERERVESLRRETPAVRWTANRGPTSEPVRAMTLLFLTITQWVGVDTGRAVHSKLWLGRTSELVEGRWRYVAGAQQQGGLARHFDRVVKQLERYLGVFEAANLLQSWQPQRGDSPGEKGARAPEGMPRHLRGEVYAYQAYELVGGVSPCLRLCLERFYGRHRAAQRPPAPSSPRSSVPAARTAAEGLEGADACRAIIDRLKHGNGPPS